MFLCWRLTKSFNFCSVNFGNGSFSSPMTNYPTHPTPHADSILIGYVKKTVRLDHFWTFFWYFWADVLQNHAISSPSTSGTALSCPRWPILTIQHLPRLALTLSWWDLRKKWWDWTIFDQFMIFQSWGLTKSFNFCSINCGNGSLSSPMTNFHHPTPPTPRADRILIGSAKKMVRLDHFWPFYDNS